MKQNYEIKTDRIRERFLAYKNEHPERLKNRLRFSWSSWGFGIEDFAMSCERLNRAGISYIELPGNHHGADLGYRPADILPVMREWGISVSGICGLYSADTDLSSNRPLQRQAAIVTNNTGNADFTCCAGFSKCVIFIPQFQEFLQVKQ